MKMRYWASVSVGIAIAVSGCTTMKSGGVRYDADSRTTIVTGKETTVQPLAGPVRTLFLKAEISPSETGLYFVVLYLSAQGWLSADQVIDSDGHKIESLHGADESFDVKYSHITKEIYYIPVTRKYLERHSGSGINFRLRGSKGVLTASQSGTLVGVFLKSLDTTQKKLADEAANKETALASLNGKPNRLLP